jgi:hypothetical protein
VADTFAFSFFKAKSKRDWRTFPILVAVYVRLAGREEQEVRRDFGAAWDEYAAHTPPSRLDPPVLEGESVGPEAVLPEAFRQG